MLVSKLISNFGISCQALSILDCTPKSARMSQEFEVLQIMASRDITEEEAERFEVECGFCSKPIAVRSLEAHIMAFHSKEYS